MPPTAIFRGPHQPDEPGYRQVDLGDLGRTDDVEYRGKELPKRDSGNDAESHPDSEIAFESGHGQTRLFGMNAAVTRCGIRNFKSLIDGRGA